MKTGRDCPETFLPSSLAEVLHDLGNKLLPIVVFSELGLRRCQDSQSCSYFEKINLSANEAREMVEELRAYCHKASEEIERGIKKDP